MDTSTINIVCTLGGFLLGILGYSRLKNKDAEGDGYIKAKLESISNGVDSVRVDMKAQDKKFEGVFDRLARVEESSKQAHKRIDNIEKEGA